MPSVILKDARIGTPELADFPAQADMQEVVRHAVAQDNKRQKLPTLAGLGVLGRIWASRVHQVVEYVPEGFRVETWRLDQEPSARKNLFPDFLGRRWLSRMRLESGTILAES